MDTYLVTAENVVLGFRAEEAMEPQRAVEESLRSRGFAVWPELEAELFAGGEETLLLARPRPPVCAGGLHAPVRLKR